MLKNYHLMKIIVLYFYFSIYFQNVYVIVPFLFAGTNQVKIYVTSNWWSQIKTAGAAIYANRHYLKLFRQTNPTRLAQALENCNGNSGNMNHAKGGVISESVFILSHPQTNELNHCPSIFQLN